LLGDEVFERLFQEAKDERLKRHGDEAWEAFERNDEEWRDRQLESLYRAHQ